MQGLPAAHLRLLALQMSDEVVHTTEALALDAARTQVNGTEVLGGSDGVVFLIEVPGQVAMAVECFEWGATIADVLGEDVETLRVDGLFAGIGGADPWANLTGYSHPQVS
jgi:hypothetical protein